MECDDSGQKGAFEGEKVGFVFEVATVNTVNREVPTPKMDGKIVYGGLARVMSSTRVVVVTHIHLIGTVQ